MTDKNLIIRLVVGISLVFSAGLNAQMHVDATGNVGIGTTLPGFQLHVLDTGKANLVIENSGTGPAKLQLKNASNNWIFNGKNTLRITSGGILAEFLLENGTGNLEILGELTTGGSLCGVGGCDLVFAPETRIESIEEHASEMWSNSYLPAVGPTIENMPFNLTKKTGGMLNELEKAHIYIEQLHKRLADVESRLASTVEISAMAASVEQLKLENQVLKDAQAQLLALQHQQQNDHESLKAMLVDLQMQAHSENVLANLE